MKSHDTTLSNDDIKEYNDKILSYVNNIEPAYLVTARAITYNIKGGQNINIEIYLTGLGIPEANKLVLLWSSPNIIDQNSPGAATVCIKAVTKKLNNKNMMAPVAGKEFIEQHELDWGGVTIGLSKGNFLPYPIFPVPDGYELTPQVMAERAPHGNAPIAISLKTLKKAKPGDYEIDVTLTYRYQNVIKQASDNAKFHITSWWDRNQWWIVTLGSIIALVLLVLTVINSLVLSGS